MRYWLLSACLLFSQWLAAQTALNFFKPCSESAIVLPDAAARKVVPNQYQTYHLDYPALKAMLQTAPMEFTTAARDGACVIALPLAGGAVERFKVWETAMAEPALAALTPYARTYAGQSLDDPRKTVYFSYTLRGFRAMILRPDFGVEYIEPYAWGQDTYYLVYDAAQLPESERLPVGLTGWKLDPSVLENDNHPFTPAVEERGTLLDPIKLRTYKFVVSTTGEWGQDNGSTNQEVYSAVVEKTNMVNAIFERDLNIRLQLIQATLLMMFHNPATDPFDGAAPGDWAGQHQQALDAANIPKAAYDVGHVYARGGGGIAAGLTCQSSKAAGCSAGSGAYGNGFIFVVCQEVGHQMAAGHTWNRCGGFAPDQRKSGTAFEPGSGSTIMSYAGGCGTDNVQGYGDLYFHGGSIEEIRNYLAFGSGGSCGALSTTTNLPPTVTLPYKNNFFIPIKTPFELNGSATDPDGDALTFCWEEMDLGPEVPLDSPTANSPLFRTFPAVTASNRYFPKLNTILNNSTDRTEQLPGWTRDLTFRLTARDNRAGGGGVAWSDVAFKAWEGAGPFVVSFPNKTNDIWRIGEYALVSWSVANTDKAPVNCQRVNIRLSTDGGLTYPTTLASDVVNDGSHYVLVPDMATTKARVRVDGADNVFFDISNQNFSIQAPAQPSLTVGLLNDGGRLCLPADHKVDILTAGVQGFNSPVTLEIAGGLPADVSASFSATTIQAGESASLTLDFSQVKVEAVFTITVKISAPGITPILRDIVLTTFRNDFSALSLTTPPNGATELQLTQTLHWTKALDALSYDVELASSPTFEPGTILASRSSTTLDSFKLSIFLAKGTPYFWRVRPNNECGAHEWTEPFFFSTYAEKCVVREASDLPKNLTSNGTPTIESTITVNAGGTIKNMEIRQIKGYHEFFKDLDVHLISPQGTDITLWSARCGNFNGSFNFRLNDAAPGGFPCPPANNGNAYRPQNPMTPFIGQNSTGTWILRMKDTQYGSGGGLQAFQLEFCSEVTLNPPYLVNNNPMTLDPGTNRAVTPDLLLVEDANNTHAQLLFTLVSAPQHGYLAINGGSPLAAGAQFAQADIDNGALRYFDYGWKQGDDSFTFMVTDGEGGFFGTPRFVILPPLVGATEPDAPALEFRLFPNPATESLHIAFSEAVPSDTRVRLFDMSGRLLRQETLPGGSAALRLELGDVPEGLYTVTVDNARGSGAQKVVVH